jgi:hypothetical protein
MKGLSVTVASKLPSQASGNLEATGTLEALLDHLEPPGMIKRLKFRWDTFMEKLMTIRCIKPTSCCMMVISWSMKAW